MADKKPVKATFDSSGDADGLSEFVTGDTVATTHGGTGLSAIGSAGQVIKVNAGANGLEWGGVEAILDIDNMTDKSSITLADTDKIPISDGGTEGYIVPTQIRGYLIKDEDAMDSNSATHAPSQQSVKAYVDANDLSLIDEDNMSSNSATRPPSQQSVKAYVDAEVTGAVTGGSNFNSATLNKDDNTVITEYQVTVGDDGSGSQNVFFYDGTNGKESELNLQAGETVRFIVEDSSIASHPFKLSTTKDGTHNSGSEYTTGKTAVGTQGQSGAYVQLVVDAGTADTLYPYCSSHSGMGGSSVFVSGGYINKDSTSTLTNKTLGATTLSGTLTGGDQEVNAVVFKDYSETDVAISYATDLAINLANGNTGSVTLTGNVSGGIDFTNVPTN